MAATFAVIFLLADHQSFGGLEMNIKGRFNFTFISSHFRRSQVRTSRWSADYVAPTFRLDELEQPLAEDDIRKFRPIMAAKNEQTSSLNYDPIIA